MRTKALKNYIERKGSVGVSRDWPIFEYPLGTGKATSFKFGRDIHRIHPNKSPLKIFWKKERGRIQDCRFFFSTPISGTDKATNFKFCTHILSIDRIKIPLQISGKVSAVVFAIAQLSCYSSLHFAACHCQRPISISHLATFSYFYATTPAVWGFLYIALIATAYWLNIVVFCC